MKTGPKTFKYSLKKKFYSKKAEAILNFILDRLKKKIKNYTANSFRKKSYVHREEDGELYIDFTEGYFTSGIVINDKKNHAIVRIDEPTFEKDVLDMFKSLYVDCPEERLEEIGLSDDISMLEVMCFVDILQENDLTAYPEELVKSLIGIQRDPIAVQKIKTIKKEIADKNVEMLDAFFDACKKQKEEEEAIRKKYEKIRGENQSRLDKELNRLKKLLKEAEEI